MMLVFFRRFAPYSIANPRILSRFYGFCSVASPLVDKRETTPDQWVPVANGDASTTNHLSGMYCSPMLWKDEPRLARCEIEVVDSDTWRVSSGLAHLSKGIDYEPQSRPYGIAAVDDGVVTNPKKRGDDPDFDEIEDMRIYGNLFYKIDRSSMEFEEYKFEFHRRKSSSNKNDKRDGKSRENPRCDSAPKGQNSSMGKEGHEAIKKNCSVNDHAFVNKERLTRTIKESYVICTPDDNDSSCVRKKQRTPTFNQLTGPYHEPFCLDIYVSRGSVRACVVHRATSKVVAVAHSISKDMKFDLGSTKSTTAAAAVGKVLAQRALADDIHNVIFMPRKGDKLEGKLQIVLQSIMDNGVNVTVKLKERNPNKPVGKHSTRGHS